MKYMINIMKLTFREVIQSRSYQSLVAIALLAPIFGLILSSLFLVDLGKVYMDGAMAISHFLSIIFVLFVSAALLARDVEQKVCYLLVIKPSNRGIYLGGRFLGLLFAYATLMALVALLSMVVGDIYLGNKMEFYQSGYVWYAMFELIFLHAFQYIALLAFVFFIFSWATGAPEIMLFSAAAILFSWAFPPILLAMNNPDVAQEVPALLQNLLHWIYECLPHLNGASIALELTHGRGLPDSAMALYVLEHLSYAGVFFMLAYYFFSRRDL